MAYSNGTATARRRILAKAKLQINTPIDQKMLDKMDLLDWNSAFDILNKRYWEGKLPKIDVVCIPLAHKKAIGLYHNNDNRIELASDSSRTSPQLLGTLLHEMCHHWVHTKYGHGKMFGLKKKVRVIGHGKQWKTEMQRVGFCGKISKYSGSERFAHLKWSQNVEI